MLERFPSKKEVIKTTTPQIKYKGEVNVTKLYYFIISWFKKKKYKVNEKKFKHKGKPDDKKIEVELTFDKKEDEFIKLVVEVRIYLDKAIVVSKGKEEIAEGFLTITVSSSIKYDYDNKFDPNDKFKDFIGRLYWLMRKRYYTIIRPSKFHSFCMSFIEDLKKELGMSMAAG